MKTSNTYLKKPNHQYFSVRRNLNHHLLIVKEVITKDVKNSASMSGARHKQSEKGECLGPLTGATHYHAQLGLDYQITNFNSDLKDGGDIRL